MFNVSYIFLNVTTKTIINIMNMYFLGFQAKILLPVFQTRPKKLEVTKPG